MQSCSADKVDRNPKVTNTDRLYLSPNRSKKPLRLSLPPHIEVDKSSCVSFLITMKGGPVLPKLLKNIKGLRS